MSNIVRYLGENTRGLSPALWEGDLAKIQDDQRMGKCVFYFNDFQAPPILSSATGQSEYYSYQDTGVTIQGRDASPPDLSKELGVLEIAGNDADNDEGHVQFGYGDQYRIDNGSGNTGKVIYEVRFNIASIANNGISIFVGLGESGVTADYLVDDSGALISTGGFVGLRTLAADGDVLEAVFQAEGQTVNTVGDAATLVANTYIKAGFIYDPSAVDTAKKIKYFVDGSEAGLYVSESEIDEATFPEGEGLIPMILSKVGSAAEVKVEIDWIASAQYADNSATN